VSGLKIHTSSLLLALFTLHLLWDTNRKKKAMLWDDQEKMRMQFISVVRDWRARCHRAYFLHSLNWAKGLQPAGLRNSLIAFQKGDTL
jgi:hypothetical protein